MSFLSGINKNCKIAVERLAACRPMSVVLFSFALLLLYTVLAIAIDTVFFRDSSEYVALIEAFRVGAYDRAFPGHLPVLYTLFAGVVARLSPLSSVSSLIFVSGLASALSVFPLYGILKKFVSEKWAAWGCVMFVVYPRFVMNCVAPLIDSSKVLFGLLALYLILSWDKKPHWSRIPILGVVYACLTLSRAEGIILVGIFMLVHLVRMLQLHSGDLRHGIAAIPAHMLLPLLVVLLLSAPRMMQMRTLTGYAALDSRQSNAVRSFAEKYLKTPPKPTPDKKAAAQTPKQNAAVQEPPQKTKIYSYETHGGTNAVMLNSHALLFQDYSGFFVSLFYVYIPFTVLGMLLWLRSWKRHRDFLPLLLLFFLYNAFFFFLRMIKARYLLLNIPILLPLTLTGIQVAWLWTQQHMRQFCYIPAAIAVIILAVSSVHSLKSMVSTKHRCFKEIGRYLPDRSLRNPDAAYPVVLFVGNDRGLGYYSDLNIVLYSKFGLERLRSIDDVVSNGVDSRYVSYWHKRRDIPEKLYIDAVVVDNKPHRREISESDPLFDLPVTCGILKLYKVKSDINQESVR